jgi:hypothetical protein
MAVTIPATVPTTNVDSGAVDTPKNARPDIKTMFDAWNTVRSQIDALGIMDIGDGVENDAQSAGTKDKLRIKLNGAGTTSGLDRSASGLKIAANGVTAAMLSTMSATAGQVLQFNGTVWGPVTLTVGEVNTTSNVGTGAQVAQTKSGVNFPFRSFIGQKSGTKPAGNYCISDVTFAAAQNANDITFTITPTWVEFQPPGGGGGS